MSDPHRLSAAELGRSLGDRLPTADSVSADELALVAAVRELMDGVVASPVGSEARRLATAHVRQAIDALGIERLEPPVRIVRHPDGRIENLIQAGTGRLNPRGLDLRYDDLSLPAAGDEPRSVEVVAHVTLGPSATGPPGRSHGGVVASILDEACGMAMMRAGRVGMTAALDVSFRAAVPLGAPLEVRARCTEFDGRKTCVTGDVLVDGTVAAHATALFVAAR